MKLIQNMVNYKVNMITGEELFKYARQFKVKISREDAEKIADYLRGKQLDIFEDQARSKALKDIAKITSPETAREINRVFVLFTK
ncbi:tRNA methyltransferase [Weizmannia acidilactici]|uniref:tRNA methyltransferase n=1 Tax=Weizmannia acidilactici TaxID=2607726 RepID=A0A5J4JDZ0_9BACI|nr:DUF2624 domain-containing protein [Weizmannia acidilactici]GER66916.1 tRNA methyltransferase [Weizmannia acidilactici]GER69569.1 tRNA methyltransferase [Weizmannia acidilactici]GER72754.1 tRNA methyltransferase [Weizmannia acidilactici]